MAFKRWIFLLFLLFTCFELSAQNRLDSTQHLPSVQISATRLQFSQWGMSIEKMDTLQSQVFGAASVADWLSNASQAFIKNYGPGRLATSAVRGSNASQTAVLWNGFNIQSQMLGQTDLSLLPIALMDEARLELGSSSILWGSGAIGGVVQLNNKSTAQDHKGWQIGTQGGIGSFGNRYLQGKIQYHRQGWTTALRGSSNGSLNNFSYQDFFGEKKRLDHSQLGQGSLMWENYWQTRRSTLAWHTWYQSANREIPPTMVQQTSQAKQFDAALRSMVDAKSYQNWGKLNLRGALFRERLDYQDILAQLDSKSLAWTAIGETIFETLPYSWGHGQMGFHHTSVWATSTNYEGQIQQHRNAFFAQFEPHIFQKNWHSLFQLRQEWVDGRRLPLLPGLRLQGQFRASQIHASLNRNYRIPTLNDLHWNPGGNPELRPEQGWSGELGWSKEKKLARSAWKYGITRYDRLIHDWILWLPGSGYWSPINVQQIWSRGLETKFGFQHQAEQWNWGINGSYDYVRSTVKQSNQPNDASVGQQLIYVPQHKALLQARLQWGAWSGWYAQNLIGSVATLPDHSEKLKAYTLGDFFWSWQKKADVQKWSTQISFNVHNVWNATYQSVVSRPMPGRSFMLNVKIMMK
jgi:iron complex outermembrane receptor protein